MRTILISLLLTLFSVLSFSQESDVYNTLGARLEGLSVTSLGNNQYRVAGNFVDPTQTFSGNNLELGDALWSNPLSPLDTCRRFVIDSIYATFAGYVDFRITDSLNQGSPSTANSFLIREYPNQGLVSVPTGGLDALRECISRHYSGQVDNLNFNDLNGIISELPAGDVTIDASNNFFTINNLDGLYFRGDNSFEMISNLNGFRLRGLFDGGAANIGRLDLNPFGSGVATFGIGVNELEMNADSTGNLDVFNAFTLTSNNFNILGNKTDIDSDTIDISGATTLIGFPEDTRATFFADVSDYSGTDWQKIDSALATGRPVLIPPGNYTLDSNFVFTSPVEIYIQEGATLTFDANATLQLLNVRDSVGANLQHAGLFTFAPGSDGSRITNNGFIDLNVAGLVNYPNLKSVGRVAGISTKGVSDVYIYGGRMDRVYWGVAINSSDNIVLDYLNVGPGDPVGANEDDFNSGLQIAYSQNILVRHIEVDGYSEAIDFNPFNRNVVIENLISRNSFQAGVELNVSSDIRVENHFSYNDMHAVHMYPYDDPPTYSSTWLNWNDWGSTDSTRFDNIQWENLSVVINEDFIIPYNNGGNLETQVIPLLSDPEASKASLGQTEAMTSGNNVRFENVKISVFNQANLVQQAALLGHIDYAKLNILTDATSTINGSSIVKSAAKRMHLSADLQVAANQSVLEIVSPVSVTSSDKPFQYEIDIINGRTSAVGSKGVFLNVDPAREPVNLIYLGGQTPITGVETAVDKNGLKLTQNYHKAANQLDVSTGTITLDLYKSNSQYVNFTNYPDTVYIQFSNYLEGETYHIQLSLREESVIIFPANFFTIEPGRIGPMDTVRVNESFDFVYNEYEDGSGIFYASGTNTRVNYNRLVEILKDDVMFWLDMEDQVGLSDGDTISTSVTLTDKVVPGVTYTNSHIAGSNPTYETNVVNGKPAIRFRGIGNYLNPVKDGIRIQGVNSPASDYVFMFVVKPDSNEIVTNLNSSTGMYLFDEGNDVEWKLAAIHAKSGGPFNKYGVQDKSATGWQLLGDYIDTLFQVLTFRLDDEYGALYRDNTKIDDISWAQPTINTTYQYIGSSDDGRQQFGGYIAEVVAFGNDVSEAYIRGMSFYLADKYQVKTPFYTVGPVGDGQGINLASNGLTAIASGSDTTVVLGGPLSTNTHIDLNNFSLTVGDTLNAGFYIQKTRYNLGMTGYSFINQFETPTNEGVVGSSVEGILNNLTFSAYSNNNDATNPNDFLSSTVDLHSDYLSIIHKDSASFVPDQGILIDEGVLRIWSGSSTSPQYKIDIDRVNGVMINGYTMPLSNPSANQVLGEGAINDNILEWVSPSGADGSETIISANSPNVSITGTGTSADPYEIAVTPDGDGIFSISNNNQNIAIDSANVATGDAFEITQGSQYGLLLARDDGITNPASYTFVTAENVSLGDVLGVNTGANIIIDNWDGDGSTNGVITITSSSTRIGPNIGSASNSEINVDNTGIEINLSNDGETFEVKNLATHSEDNVMTISNGGVVGKQAINKTRSWTIRSTNPGANEVVNAGSGFIFDGSTAGWTSVIDPTNLVAGDIVRIKIVDADANAITLDATTGSFYYNDSTPTATVVFSGAQHDLELFWDGTNFIIFE